MLCFAGGNEFDDYRRWSLGRSICASCHLPLRILAANILREISLADIDVRLFWSSDLLERNDPRLPSSFLADGQWLRDTIMCLRDLGDPRATPDERYALRVQDSKMLICAAEERLMRYYL